MPITNNKKKEENYHTQNNSTYHVILPKALSSTV